MTMHVVPQLHLVSFFLTDVPMDVVRSIKNALQKSEMICWSYYRMRMGWTKRSGLYQDVEIQQRRKRKCHYKSRDSRSRDVGVLDKGDKGILEFHTNKINHIRYDTLVLVSSSWLFQWGCWKPSEDSQHHLGALGSFSKGSKWRKYDYWNNTSNCWDGGWILQIARSVFPKGITPLGTLAWLCCVSVWGPKSFDSNEKTCPQNYWNPGNYIHDVFLLISEKSSQADNCVRESKNQWTLKLFSYLLATGHCRLAALLFSRVGHTHGVLGALIPCGNAFLLRQIIFSWEGFKFDVDYLEWLVSWVGPRFSRFHPGISLLLSPKPRGNSCLKHLLHIQDQLFGLVATAMRYIDILCDEADVVERLDKPVDWNHFVAKPFLLKVFFARFRKWTLNH